jgi:hypothetical protein
MLTLKLATQKNSQYNIFMIDAAEPIPQQVPETPPLQNPAQTAASFFVKVSQDCPASVTAQAAGIQLLARQAGIQDTVELGKALTKDENRLKGILNAAQNAHKQAGEYNAPQNTSKNHAITMVLSVFSNAEDLKPLTDEQLRLLTTTVYTRAVLSYKTSSDKEHEDRDEYVSATAKQMLREKGIES